MSSNLPGISSRIASSDTRNVPVNSTCSAIRLGIRPPLIWLKCMLRASPMWKLDANPCNPVMTCPATFMASTPSCGDATWDSYPVMVSRTLSLPVKAGPARNAIDPAGQSG